MQQVSRKYDRLEYEPSTPRKQYTRPTGKNVKRQLRIVTCRQSHNRRWFGSKGTYDLAERDLFHGV